MIIMLSDKYFITFNKTFFNKASIAIDVDIKNKSDKKEDSSISGKRIKKFFLIKLKSNINRKNK
jgi:hypothetical protein